MGCRGSGECDTCMVMIYDDDVFREKWVAARKRRVDLAQERGMHAPCWTDSSISLLVGPPACRPSIVLTVAIQLKSFWRVA